MQLEPLCACSRPSASSCACKGRSAGGADMPQSKGLLCMQACAKVAALCQHMQRSTCAHVSLLRSQKSSE